MAEDKFYIQRYIKNTKTGAWVEDGDEKSLEEDFGFCRYKSLSGVSALGKQKAVYVETYAEADSARVWFGSNPKREQITHELQLYFFGYDPRGSAPEDKTTKDFVLKMQQDWRSLRDYLQGGLVVWRDEVRQMRFLFYVLDAPTIANDVVKNTPYLQVTLKLANVFGQTFELSDKTIDDWLANGGKEDMG